MSEHWKLVGRDVVRCSLDEWARGYDGDKRRIGSTSIGDIRVSTVFLGLDHSFGEGPPLLFETMVFGGPLDQEQERYSTYDEAEAGHALMIARVRAAEVEPA